MAQEAGDGLSLNEDRPDIDQPHGYDYRELQHIKKGMRIRLEKEHNAAAATLATNSAGGEHLNGSAVAYEGSSGPSKRPDTSTDLADNAYDRGRLWLDDNYDPPVLKRWDGSAWEVIGRMLVDDESLVVYLSNEKQENIDGGRETKLIFKGVKADGTAHELAMLQVSHDGIGDDYKGDIILYVNDGNDAAGSLTEVLRIDSAKLATFAGAITAGGIITNPEIPVFTKGIIANDTYLQGRNSADDGNVDMIKIGRNEADDTDVVQLPDEARLTTDAAPTEDTQIANKKYTDDQCDAHIGVAGQFHAAGDTVFNTTMTAASTFQDLDLSSVVGSNSALVFLEVLCNGTITFAVKPKGYGGAYSAHVLQNSVGGCCMWQHANDTYSYGIVATDASGVVQIGAGNNSSTFTIKIVGYIK